MSRKIAVHESNRWCAVTRARRLTVAGMRREILRGEGVSSGFSVLPAPAPAHDDTAFKVWGAGREIVVAVALYDSVRPLSSPGGGPTPDSVEILFDPRHDRIGWFQFVFAPPRIDHGALKEHPHRDPDLAGDVQILSHQPYPEAHSSGAFHMRLKKSVWKEDVFTACTIMQHRCRWLFAWFDAGEVFRYGPVCGFNICRSRSYLFETSSWNYSSGNGFQDATGFGRLYRDGAPPHVADVTARREGNRLRLAGRFSGGTLGLELADPEGRTADVPVVASGDRWTAEVGIDGESGGRHRFRPIVNGAPAEPGWLAVDVPAPAPARRFCMSVLYDSPMSIIANSYTPERIDRDMRTWAGLGMHRVHWIEYGDWPSFWNAFVYRWGANYRRTVKACGGYLEGAVRAAHANGLELIADLKTFDLGMNCQAVDGFPGSSAPDIENRRFTVIPEIAAHPEWTWQANPDWSRPTAFPITRIRLYSETPIPALRRSEIRIEVSADNCRFAAYRKPYRVRQGTVRRPHERWTPAGTVREPGSRLNWYVEFDGLAIGSPYVAVRLAAEGVRLTQRGYMVAEATDAAGRRAPLTVATNGDTRRGFFFWKGWQGWSNQTEALLQERVWSGDAIGLVFREAPSMPTLLEPGFAGARDIWLARIGGILDAGADGVDIRTYCHHNGPMCYLKYAFAGPVREAFRERFGRDPRPEPADYQRVREIRGGFYTEFIRAAKRLVSSRGRRLMVEFESGIEVPAQYDVRMQLPMEWRTWIEEGLVDEIRMKWFTAQSPFVHDEILPLARRRGIPVQLISRCLHTGIEIRAEEMAERIVGGACAAGFSGYTFYEQQNLMDLNPEGISTLKGPVGPFFRKARETLARMAGEEAE